MTGSLHGRTILIVEDEPVILVDLFDALDLCGATVLVAATIAEAMKYVERGGISAAIIDRSLPDGFCTPICEQLNSRDIPFVMHSGRADLDAPCRRGVIFEKPANTSDMTATIEGFFTEHRP